MNTKPKSPSARILALAVLAFTCSAASGLAAARLDQLLSDGWKFTRADAGPTASADAWESVTIPHTWNTIAADAGDHKGDPHYAGVSYYRGACWYARSLDIPAAWKGQRVFIRFEAASIVARAYINGQALGEHRGAFTAFCYELTPYLRYGAANELRVQVDNSHQEDVPPLSGDFNMDGGLYRPVHLIVTDPVCISPLNMASPGVYLTAKSLDAGAAQVEVKTLVSNGSGAPANVQVRTDIADAEGKIVASATQPAALETGTNAAVVVSTVTIPSPHLWNARKDPYLYTATVSLASGGGDAAGDAVQQPLGLRTVAIDEQRGFLLNGQPYPIRGVNKHQDWGDQGWATTYADFDEDARIILDMGVTAIRLTHYPQSDYWHNLSDHNGLLLWNEVSLVNYIHDTPAFDDNAEQQLRELILQRYNHPSAVFWGLFNEIGNQKGDAPDSLLKRLKAVVQELDTTRVIVAATDHNKRTFNLIPDHTAFNMYPGWYGKFGTMEANIQTDSTEIGKRIAISEYGAGSNAAQHAEGPLTQPAHAGPFHPQEWQTYVHEADYAAIKGNPHLWGTFIWVMFDFQSSVRHEGSLPHVNDKGLVTEDRKTKKDAYYFYQANWTDTPMVHIAAKELTPRHLGSTGIEVFSNCPSVQLTLNGRPLGAASPDGVCVFRWQNVTLQPGRNEVQAVAASGGGQVTDSCVWDLEPGTAAAN